MSSVDDRIVNMRFNNTAFEQGVGKTLGSLDKLKKGLDFRQSSKNLGNLQNAAGRFNMGNMGASVQGISKKFIALGTIGVTALANITNRAVSAGLNMVKSLSVSPIMQGMSIYETKLNAIQTILANTGLEGKAGLTKVGSALAILNDYSNKTIYNFGEMARNIGTFTAAGVDLKTSVSAIKGIANLAAVSGSNSQQASTAMYQLSQALAAGRVKLQDWNSVVNAGMGGKVFQHALMDTARVHGVAIDKMVKSEGGFRNTLQKGWLTSSILTETLNKFTGDLTAKQLKAQGYTAKQIIAIQKLGKVATEAATKVKTFPQLMDVLKESVSTGWANSFEIIFGNIDEAKTLFTDINNVVGGFISKSAEARNKVLGDWKKLGGRTLLIKGIKEAFQALGSVIKPIKDAFREIFPAKTGKDLYDFTVRFENLMDRLKLGSSTANDLKRTFKGVFAVFDIVKQVIGGAVHMFGQLFSMIFSGSGSFLHFTGGIGDFLVSLDKALKKGDSFTKFFTGLGSILAIPLKALSDFKNFIFSLFDGFNGANVGDISTSVSNLGASFSGTAGQIQDAWNKIVSFLGRVRTKLQPFTDGISRLFGSIGQSIKDTFSSQDFTSILQLFRTVLLGGIAVSMKKFLSKGFSVDVGKGMLSKIGDSFEQLTGTLKSMQLQLKAKALLEIGIAIALLTASVVTLSLVNPQKLDSSTKALALLFTQLLIAMGVLTKITSTAGFVKLPVIAGSMILLAGAVLLLTVAVKSLAKMDWKSLKKGLAGVGIALAELTASAVIISATPGSMARTGVGMIALALAVNILARAVKFFAEMKWSEILRGLTGVAGVLVVIAGAMHLMPRGMLLQSASLVVIAGALMLLSRAVKSFADMQWKTMGKGLAGVAASLVVLAGAMRLMPPGMIAQSIALGILSLALKGIAKAVASMGSLNWKTIGKGLTGLAGGLAILAVALEVMSGTIGGAIALTIASIAIGRLSKVLAYLGALSWNTILHGLVALAGTLTVIGLTAALLGTFSAAMVAFAVALLAVGAAVLLVGGGIYLFGKGMAALAEGGSASVAILLKAIDGFIARIPELAIGLAKGLVGFILVLGKNAPGMVGALADILKALMQAIIDVLPTALTLFTKLIHTLLIAIANNAPDIIRGGLNLLVDFLNGIANAMPRVIRSAVDVIVAFLNGIGNNIGRIIQGGFNLIVKFLNGLADGIEKNLPRILKAGSRIGWAIIKGLGQGFADAIGGFLSAVGNFLGSIWDKITGFFDINSPSKKMMWVGKQLINGIWEGIKKLAPWIMHKLTGILGDIWDQVTGAFDDTGTPFDPNNPIAKQIADRYKKKKEKKKPKTTPPSNSGDGIKPNSVGVPRKLGGPGLTIKPVVDLTGVTKGIRTMSALASSAMSVETSLGNASAIVAATSQTAPAASDVNPVPSVTNEYKFEQNNYSPKALSAIEIYRQTRNQISLAKEALST